jgi:pSer/pThr/pTyr-binding forkhead associated (FHA) protein
VKAELVPSNGDAPIPITKDVTVLGRREFCDVQIEDPSLSKRHCVLVRTDGLLMIRDLATTNGTKVNGRRIMWAALLPNDRLTLGRRKFRVYLGSDEAQSPSEQTFRGGSRSKTTKGRNGRAEFAPETTPLPLPAQPEAKSFALSTDEEVPELIGPDDLLLDDDSDELEILSG